MMRLEDTWFVAAFHSNPMHDPGLKEVQRPARVCVCKGASALPCLLSCCCWRRRPPAVRRSRLRAAPPPDAGPPESPWCRPVVGLPMVHGECTSAVICFRGGARGGAKRLECRRPCSLICLWCSVYGSQGCLWTSMRVMPRRRAAGGRNPRPTKTTDEGEVKIPCVLICFNTHRKNRPIKTCLGCSFPGFEFGRRRATSRH